jgi:hypothetical protein
MAKEINTEGDRQERRCREKKCTERERQPHGKGDAQGEKEYTIKEACCYRWMVSSSTTTTSTTTTDRHTLGTMWNASTRARLHEVRRSDTAPQKVALGSITTCGGQTLHHKVRRSASLGLV